jgi:hypothetical protein
MHRADFDAGRAIVPASRVRLLPGNLWQGNHCVFDANQKISR